MPPMSGGVLITMVLRIVLGIVEVSTQFVILASGVGLQPGANRVAEGVGAEAVDLEGIREGVLVDGGETVHDGNE